MADNKTYLPKQKTTRGKAGYKMGDGIVVVDPDKAETKKPDKSKEVVGAPPKD